MLSARLERFDVTAPITFVLAGVLLTHGPLAPLGFSRHTRPSTCSNRRAYAERQEPIKVGELRT
jgi:hypothetical protein